MAIQIRVVEGCGQRVRGAFSIPFHGVRIQSSGRQIRIEMLVESRADAHAVPSMFLKEEETHEIQKTFPLQAGIDGA